MKLKLMAGEKHTDVVASCCWSPDNKLYSMSDDKTILAWDYTGEFESQIINYLHVGNHQLGVIFNFGVKSLEYHFYPNKDYRYSTRIIP